MRPDVIFMFEQDVEALHPQLVVHSCMYSLRQEHIYEHTILQLHGLGKLKQNLLQAHN